MILNLPSGKRAVIHPIVGDQVLAIPGEPGFSLAWGQESGERHCPSNSSVRFTKAEADATASAGGQLEALGELELAEVVGVELAGLDVQVLAGQEQAAQAELAIALGVDQARRQQNMAS